MTSDDASSIGAEDLGALIRAWSAVPALVLDRHLNVQASNAVLQALAPELVPGANLAVEAFLRAPARWSFDEGQPNFITAALRELLEDWGEDSAFLDLIGELAAQSRQFASSWAESDASQLVGHFQLWSKPDVCLEFVYFAFRSPSGDDRNLVIWHPADPSAVAAVNAASEQSGPAGPQG